MEKNSKQNIYSVHHIVWSYEWCSLELCMRGQGCLRVPSQWRSDRRSRKWSESNPITTTEARLEQTRQPGGIPCTCSSETSSQASDAWSCGCSGVWGVCLLVTPLSSIQFSSVAQSCPTLLRPRELQHARPPCPSPTPRAYSNSCLLSWWCHPTISSSVVPFSFCPQSFPASGSFPVSQLFASGGQSFGVSASESDLPMNTQDWSPLGWTGWISLQSKRLSRVFSNTTVQKHQFFSTQLSLQFNSHIHTWLLEKP